MKIEELINKLKQNKIKLFIASVTVLTTIIAGISIYALNDNNEEETELAEEVLVNKEPEAKEETKEEEKPEVQDEAPKDINIQDEKKEVQQEQVKQEEVKKEQIKKVKPKIENTPNKGDEKKARKEQFKQQVKKEANKTPITYTSKTLGIAFDMPGSWKDNYVIKEERDTIRVYMKHNENSKGLGFLFLITSNVNAHDGGNTLDGWGIPKRSNFGGKEFLVGGPLDCPIHENDPLKERFTTMAQESHQVTRTIRAI